MVLDHCEGGFSGAWVCYVTGDAAFILVLRLGTAVCIGRLNMSCLVGISSSNFANHLTLVEVKVRRLNTIINMLLMCN